jgi:hypothetical protein
MSYTNARPQNTFIVGTPYSGSTLLANALNAHSAIITAGELSACFPDFPLGVQDPFCPVCAAANQPCPLWTKEFISRVRAIGPRNAIDLIRQVSGSPVVVDASKFPDWLDYVYKDEPVDTPIKIVFILRCPFAFHASNARRADVPAERSANQWLYVADAIERVTLRLGADKLNVHYEDFALDPKPILASICHYLGIHDESERMIRFWEFPIHALNGNAGAYIWYETFRENGLFERAEDVLIANEYKAHGFGGWKDDKWEKQVSDADIHTIMSCPGLVKKAKQLGSPLTGVLKTAGRRIPTSFSTSPEI